MRCRRAGFTGHRHGAPGGHESSAGRIASHVFQWCAETLLTHSDSRSPGAELLMSPRLRMPIIRLLLLITGNLRTCSFSMCRTALARSSSSRQQWMRRVMHVARRRAAGIVIVRAILCRRCHGRSPCPISRSFSPMGMCVYVMFTHHFREFGGSVSARTESGRPCVLHL